MPESRILITSAGSLVGRAVMSTLAGRRDSLFVVGGDLNPGALGVLDCDEVTSQPPVTDEEAFVEAIRKAVTVHAINLVIPGRDPDAAALAGVPDVPQAGCTADLVSVTRDKWLTHEFCAAHSIPFAPTVVTPVESVPWPLPLIAKPRDGSGSMGVRVLLTDAQVRAACATPGLVLQPFLDPPENLRTDLADGVPLFWEVECRAEYGVQALIGPDGVRGPQFSFVAEHRWGRNERLAPCREESLVRFGQDVVPRLAAAGFRGPVNLQVRRDGDGWRLIEINARFSGGTAGRYLLGFDEVGWVLNQWLGEGAVPSGPEQLADEVRWLPQEFGVWHG